MSIQEGEDILCLKALTALVILLLLGSEALWASGLLDGGIEARVEGRTAGVVLECGHSVMSRKMKDPKAGIWRA